MIKSLKRQKVLVKLTEPSTEMCLMVQQDGQVLTEGNCPVHQWSGTLNANEELVLTIMGATNKTVKYSLEILSQ